MGKCGPPDHVIFHLECCQQSGPCECFRPNLPRCLPLPLSSQKLLRILGPPPPSSGKGAGGLLGARQRRSVAQREVGWSHQRPSGNVAVEGGGSCRLWQGMWDWPEPSPCAWRCKAHMKCTWVGPVAAAAWGGYLAPDPLCQRQDLDHTTASVGATITHSTPRAL